MHNVFYSVLPIFLIALIGSVIRRKWLTSDEFWRGLEKLSFYVLFPTVFFEHTSQIDLSSTEFFKLITALVISTLIISGMLVVYQIYKPFDKVQFTSVFQGATRYNNYIFFALSAALFGRDGVTVVASIAPYLIVMTNVIAIIIFVYYIPKNASNISRRQTFVLTIKSIVANPFILASILGFSCNYFDITLNVGIEKTIHSLANSALAIGMLIVGAGIKFRIKPEYFNQVVFTSSFKLIVMPIVTFVILWVMGVSGTARSVGILFSCLPCASSSYILSRQLGGDPETMSSTITFTTLLSILSLSLLVYILV